MKTVPPVRIRTLAVLLTSAFLAVSSINLRAQTWQPDRSGDYLAASNWIGGIAPGISSNVLFLNPDLLTTSTVTFSDSATNAQVLFNRGVFVVQTGVRTWTLTNLVGLRVGNLNSAGASADLTFDGGTVNVSTGQVVVGRNANDDNNVLRLTNSATFDSQGTFETLVGRSGSSNQLVIGGGSTYAAAGLNVGTLTGSDDNRVTVHGAGSELRLRGNLALNVDQGTSGNALVISNGGAVYVTNATASAARVLLGWSPMRTTDGASILITGSGSRLVSTTDEIAINMATAGSRESRITVADGGLLDAPNASLSLAFTNDNTKARFIMDGGTANLRRTTLQRASMDILSGELNFSQDFTTAGTYNLNFAGGTVSAGSANFLSGALTVGDGSGIAADYILTGNGTHGIGSVLTVQSDGSVSGNGVIAASTNGTTATAVLNSGTVSAGAGQTLRVVGSFANQTTGSTLSVTDGGVLIASAASTNAGTVNIGIGSSIIFSNGLSGTGAVVNDGTLTIGASGGGGDISGTISGAGSLNKLGTGTLTLSGASANTFTGTTTVTAGVLELHKTAGTDALAGDVTLNSGAILLISASNQLNNSADVTLSGGTIQRGSGVSEVFGNLNVTTGSFLNFSGGTGGTVEFSGLAGGYTPSSAVALQLFNFTQGNTFVIRNTSNWANQINSGFTFGGDGGFGSSSFVDEGGGVGTFTITAIPEPSTYLAAAGLLSLMLWPSRKLVIREAKKVLGLNWSTQ